MDTIKVHLDTDIGGDIDDLCALAMLLEWPQVDMTGITTVAEENGRRAGYAKYALRMAGRSGVPVAAGADVTQVYFRWKPDYPAESDYWPEPVAPSPSPVEQAIELLKASVEADALIIGIGPCTNLALLDQSYPGLLRHAQLFLMGGYVAPAPPEFPQLGTELDYNLQMDVPSARRVIEGCRPTLIPLGVSVQTALRRSHLSGLRQAGPLGALLARQAAAFAEHERNDQRYGRTRSGLPDDIINFQHDPLACAVALGWDGVRTEELPILLETRDGWLNERVDDAGTRMRVVTAVDGPAFNELWYELVSRKSAS